MTREADCGCSARHHTRFIRSTCGLSSFIVAAQDPSVCRNFGSLSQHVRICSSPWIAEFVHNAVNRDGENCVTYIEQISEYVIEELN